MVNPELPAGLELLMFPKFHWIHSIQKYLQVLMFLLFR
jgi:hypothetical protein